MNYSVNLLLTKADCDAVLALLAKDSGAITQRKTSAEFTLTQFDATGPAVAGSLTAVTGQLAGIATYINSLPAGSDARRKVELEKERLDVQQRLLSGRQENWGGVARIERENSLARLTAELAEIATCQAQVVAHKDSLSA